MTKPRIADLERNYEQDRMPEVAEIGALLRLARAAKEYSDMTLMADDEEDGDTKAHLEDRAEMDWDEMQKALDAFEWGEE